MVEKCLLGLDGDITPWLVLGYLPIPSDAEGRKASFDSDLLAGLGGEACIQPTAGQAVALRGNVYVWRFASSCVHPMLKYGNWRPWVQLFHGEQGEPLLHVAAYAYTRLVCAEAMEARLVFGTDDGAKLFLNGELLHRFPQGRPFLQDDEEVVVRLREGANDLVFRVENYGGYGGIQARLVDAGGRPPGNVSVELNGVEAGCATLAPRGSAPWEAVIAAIPPVPPARHPEWLGARLARTMALLESGGGSRRPVRLLFYGQSIDEQDWNTLLVDRLRERYPDTTILAENHAIGGWVVPTLLKRFKHDILRRQPDLVSFHAYGGVESHWERVLSELRRETTADILIRTAHEGNPSAESRQRNNAKYDSEALLLRGLASKYAVELVEVRQEWLGYLDAHGMASAELLGDSIHLNHGGNVLMAQLYERHFQFNPTIGDWFARVRRHEALRPIADRRDDGIVLDGEGWVACEEWVESASKSDVLRLTFRGNRVDVVLGPCRGGARVLIDGRPPSALNLFHGTGPMQPRRYAGVPAGLVRYFEGGNLLEETWELRFREIGEGGRSFRFELFGSRTGPDGEGDHEHEFVSTSGRIAISPRDWLIGGSYRPDPSRPDPLLRWQVVAHHRDVLRGEADDPAGEFALAPSHVHVMVADGLPFGRHTLAIVPEGDAPIAIRAVEVHRPPLAEADG